MFNPSKVILARQRRKMTAKRLAELAGVTPVTISRLEKGSNEPDQATADAIGRALDYPVSFFYGDDIEELPVKAASFRSLSAMTARESHAALAAGQLAFAFDDWVAERFNRPEPKVTNFADAYKPDAAARAIREAWGLGEKPVTHVIKVLEAKGVRVFSLAEETRSVDAFSCWRGDVPYVFLNTFKTAEHRRFDAAHELGHLVLHRHGDANGRRNVEMEANAFASEFLMPRHDVLAHVPIVTSLKQIIQAKHRWGVSVMALTYRLHTLGILTYSQYRRLCIQANKAGYRRTEPEPIGEEKSVVWEKVFRELWRSRMTKDDLARELGLPQMELENLVFGLLDGGEPKRAPRSLERPNLTVVNS